MQRLLFLCILLFDPINLLLNSKSPYDYSSYKSVSKDTESIDETIKSTNSDESAVYITESGLLIQKPTIGKESGDSSKIEDSNLYGVNSAVLVQGGSLTITEAKITSEANGAHALFSTNEGSASGSVSIITKGSSSGGLITTYDGVISIVSSTITTNGDSSPLTSTEEGGSISCKDSTISTKGKNSDLAQSKGDGSGTIVFDNVNGSAEKSKIGNIDGKVSFIIQNQSKVKCSANPIKENIDPSGVMLYQSKSKFNNQNTFGCTESTLEILDSSNYYSTAPMFFVTNTQANIQLKNCQLIYGSNIFINIKATNEWGIKGSNGADVSIQFDQQDIEGDFLIDAGSTLNLNLIKSNIKGKINPSNTVKSLIIRLDRYSTITITGNSYCTTINNELKDGSNLINGSYTWTIGTPSNNDNNAEGIYKSNLIKIGIILLINILLL